MKPKFLKFGMPVMAFILAIAFAFASERTTSEKSSLIEGYIFEDNVCTSASRECNNVSGPVCKQGVFQVYMTNLGGTACITELTHWP